MIAVRIPNLRRLQQDSKADEPAILDVHSPGPERLHIRHLARRQRTLLRCWINSVVAGDPPSSGLGESADKLGNALISSNIKRFR